MEDISKNKKIFITYLDDNDKQVSGFVDLIEITDTLVAFSTTKNIVKIPMHRLLKIKETLEDGGAK